MPSSLLLLLPLLGGYLFNHFSHILRFRAQTQTGHRLILEAAATGVVFLGLARAIALALMWLDWPESLLGVWPAVTNGIQFVGTAILTVALCCVSAVIDSQKIALSSMISCIPLPASRNCHVRRKWSWQCQFQKSRALTYWTKPIGGARRIACGRRPYKEGRIERPYTLEAPPHNTDIPGGASGSMRAGSPGVALLAAVLAGQPATPRGLHTRVPRPCSRPRGKEPN